MSDKLIVGSHEFSSRLIIGTGKFKDYAENAEALNASCLLYTSPSPRDLSTSRMPSSA